MNFSRIERVRRWSAPLVGSIVAATAAGSAHAADAGPTRYLDRVFDAVHVDSNIVYGRAAVDDEPQDLKLDLYRPVGDAGVARPVVIYAHGGAFTHGIKESGHDTPYPIDYAKRGFVAASIDYRLDGSETDATDDMQASVRWFRAHAAELGVDPDRITVIGSSSGAVMAMSATFAPEDAGESGNPGYASNVAAGMAISGNASHADTITAGDPPIAMFHALDDTTIPYARAQATCQETQAMGNVCEMFTYETGGHPPPFAIANEEDIAEKSSDFLARRIGIDTTRPSTTDDVPAGWRPAPVGVTLAGSDTGGSGLSRTYYTTGADPADPTTASSVYSGASKPALADGERIKYFSVDRAGNAEAVRTSPVAHVDTDAPATTDDVPTGYQHAPVPVTLSASDSGGSGLARTYYTKGADPPDPTTASSEYDGASKPALGDGERIKYFSTDGAGNAGPVETSRVAEVDGAAPESTAVTVPSTERSSIAVSYTAHDVGSSGLDRVELYVKPPGAAYYGYRGTDSSPAESGRFFAFPLDQGYGDYSFYTVAYDKAGNAEASPEGADAVTTFSAAPPPTRVVTLVSSALRAAADGTVTLALSNPNPYDVTGALRLRTAKRGLPLGPARTFSIPAGIRASVPVTLPKPARDLLARKRQLLVRVTLTTRGVRGAPVRSSRTLVLNAAPPRHSPSQRR